MQKVVVKAARGVSTVLYIVPGARQISALGDAKPGRGGGLAGWARLPAWGQLTRTQIAESTGNEATNKVHRYWAHVFTGKTCLPDSLASVKAIILAAV